MTEQMPTVAFTMEESYIRKLDEMVKKSKMTKSQYLRTMIKALIDAEERFTQEQIRGEVDENV
jgi:hypothetical protein